MSRIKYFGIVAEIVGLKEEERQLNELKVGDFKREFLNSHPELASNFQIAIDQNLADDETLIMNENEIAILPPYSGG